MQNIYKISKNKRALVLLLLLSLLCTAIVSDIKATPDAAAAAGRGKDRLLLYVGGMPFGVKFYTEGVLVVGFAGGGTARAPAYAAGLRVNDTIIKIDDKPISDAAELTDIIKASGGKPLKLTCRRDGRADEEYTATLTPQRGRDGQYSTGMWVRDSGAGIGTVTFTVPDTGGFGGLGHGICDADTGKPVPLGRGCVVGVSISGISRGTSGAPGEIKGYFDSKKLGSVIKNSDLGVFGLYNEPPVGKYTEPIPAATRDEVNEGAATILCTLDDGEIGEYTVEISAIDRSAKGGRCFSVRVTDPTLLERTGGIIQGMSGSPIIQNGRLIGAVTHVLINDSASGYGIFIENMYDAMPSILRGDS